MISLTTLLALLSPAAEAACVIDRDGTQLNDGLEKPDGVPNWDQGDFDGDNDCGPTAAGMLLGYWDTHGWECMVDGEPFYTSSSPTQSITFVNERLQDEMPYDGDWGTWNAGVALPFFTGDIGSTVHDVARMQDPGASGWSTDDHDNVTASDMKTQLNRGNPMMLLILLPDYLWGGNWRWRGTDDKADPGDIAYHWMPILGYEHVELGLSFFGCVDWLMPDDFWVITRSGWRSGGDSRLWYNWSGIDFADWYTVDIEPGGSPTCVDLDDSDGDGHGNDAPVPGYTPGDDCDDTDGTVFPGAPELCDGQDNDCDGRTDEGPDDLDGDGVRDECDPDDDGDGVIDTVDVCPGLFDPEQRDRDADGIGDDCDACPDDERNDADGDDRCFSVDNCPDDANRTQADTDGDGRGDVCDDDADGDGYPNDIDTCWLVAHVDNIDRDLDGLGDVCDNCIEVSNPEQGDIDRDDLGDLCDDDMDGDEVPNEEDNCPEGYNPDQVDSDDNGVGLACDEEEQVLVFIAKIDAFREKLAIFEWMRDPTVPYLPDPGCLDCTEWQRLVLDQTLKPAEQWLLDYSQLYETGLLIEDVTTFMLTEGLTVSGIEAAYDRFRIPYEPTVQHDEVPPVDKG